jgi:outer membrane protein assembly factor BamB
MRIGLFLTATSCTLFLLQQAGRAADWPQYRGPDQTGISAESVNLSWPADGPKLVWKIPTKNGFSSFAISGGKVCTQVNREIDGEKREVCVALDAATGKELWAVDVGVGKYDSGGDSGTPDNRGGDGPRSTPTISEGKVYVLTQDLVVRCLDAETGKQVWIRDLVKQHAGRNIGWKSAASPVVDGDRVFLGGGGRGQSLLALDKKTGEVLWKDHDETITHSTPVATTIHGERQVVFFLKSGLLSVAAKDGKALWRFPFPFNVSTAISPIVSGDVVYCSAGYDVGGGACRIVKDGDQYTAKQLWRISGVKLVANHWSTPVVKDGHLYGMFSFKRFGVGPLKCVELATGKVEWEQPGFGAGNVILVKDKVLALADDGQLVVVEATPKAYQEVARFKAVTGKCWSTPALSDGKIYVRSTKEGACLALDGQR